MEPKFKKVGSATVDDRFPGLIERYLAGETLLDLSIAYNTHHERVRLYLDECGIPRRHANYKTEVIPAGTIARYASGESLSSIAASLHVSFKRLREYLEMNGVDVDSGATVERVVASFNSGATLNDLRQHFGLSIVELSKLLQEGGIDPSRCVIPENVIQRYQDGEGSTSIASTYGVSDGVILNLLDEHKIPRNPPRIPVKSQSGSADLMAHEYVKGASLFACQRRYGYTRKQVKAALEARGIAIRPEKFRRMD